jgi:hypothetical protein
MICRAQFREGKDSKQQAVANYKRSSFIIRSQLPTPGQIGTMYTAHYISLILAANQSFFSADLDTKNTHRSYAKFPLKVHCSVSSIN